MLTATEAAELEALCLGKQFPASMRSYVSGQGQAVGVLVNRINGRPYVKAWDLDDWIRDFNAAIARWFRKRQKWFHYTTIQFNSDTVSDWHRDSGNAGLSIIFGLGSYTGGALQVEDSDEVSIHHRLVVFDGRERHRSLEFQGRRFSVVLFTSNRAGDLTMLQKQELENLGFPGVEPARLEGDTVIEARKGAHQSYKTRDKAERDAKLFPELEKEIAKKRAERRKSLPWSGERRFSSEYKAEMARVSADLIGGTDEERGRFFEEVVGAYPQCFWLEGCDPPAIQDKLIGFRLKDGAKPVARQPIALSPFDQLRVEYHIEEFIHEGKLRKIDTDKEPLPEWTTPVFVVDQDAKGLLGRLVCSYGVVNAAMEIPSFPSADPKRAFDLAAGKSHHSVVDAIWGYTQFLIDEPTKKMLVICTPSGLYEWLRMPFGPAPAPAEMQSYVATRFGGLKDRDGALFCSPCMDDIKVSSGSFEKHIDDMRRVCDRASKSAMEFKLTKAQFNQSEIKFWGVICDGVGRRPEPKKVRQLEEWPEPKDAPALSSFLCFVNYLREHLAPDWIKHEETLRPFRKKGVDFPTLWNSSPKYREAFRAIREAVAKDAVLYHVDYEAAAHPNESGRPYEMFIDASDYGWAATLCQRQEPMGAPKIVGVVAKGFSDVQQRWSAMERELYALWQGVLAHDRMIRGFQVYCYIDHKNNIFSEAQLDNRRRSKKMSNWALDLQWYHLVRVWIRGEANILGDAPSRAPWEAELAKFLPIPDKPVRELVNLMYKSPGAMDVLVQSRKKEMLGEGVEWQPIPAEDDGTPVEAKEVKRQRDPPTFGTEEEGPGVEHFGRCTVDWLSQRGGDGGMLPDGPWYPRWPVFVGREVPDEPPEPDSDEDGVPVPVRAQDRPIAVERRADTRGDNFIVWWEKAVEFNDGKMRKSCWFNVRALGEKEALRRAWEYFRTRHCELAEVMCTSSVGVRERPFGPLGEYVRVKHGFKAFHGREDHRFRVHAAPPATLGEWRMAAWDSRVDTFESAEKFCGHCRSVGRSGLNVREYECLGHLTETRPESVSGYMSRFEAGGSAGAEPPSEAREDPEGPGESPATPGGFERDIPTDAESEGEPPEPPPMPPPPDEPPSGDPEPDGPDDGAGDGGADEDDGAPPAAPPPPPPPGDAGAPKAAPDQDYWDYHPSKGAWARVHVRRRRETFEPWEFGEESADGGPKLQELSPKRVTMKKYTRDETQDVVRDEWCRVVEGENQEKDTAHKVEKETWTGLTWFYLKDAEADEAALPRRRLRGKRADPSLERGLEVWRDLMTSAEVGRDSLARNLTASGQEKTKLMAAQRQCRDFGAYVAIHLALEGRREAREALLELRRTEPDLVGDRKIDSLLESARHYELVQGVLFRRWYNPVSHEVELRLAVPDRPWGKFDVPGRGLMDLGHRERIIHEFHSGLLGGHRGREKTMIAIQDHFWWPGMFKDVKSWCNLCQQCRGEKGPTGVSAWSRTEIYSRPFRVLQFDTVTCGTSETSNHPYVLTVICCFSRWCWLVPLKKKDAPSIAKALLVRVFADLAMFPTVLRSDNAGEFIGEVMQQLNKMLNIRHITSSTYHPQSQGMVESMHKTLNQVVRGLVGERPKDWEEMIPFAQCILRTSPMKDLEWRTPYEVVTGMKPKLPVAMVTEGPREFLPVGTYVEQLRSYMTDTYSAIDRIKTESLEKHEGETDGRRSAVLEVGDAVLVKREASEKRAGPTRFQPRVYPGVYKISVKISEGAFRVQDLADPEAKVSFTQPVNADRLIRLDLPELSLDARQPRCVEIKRESEDEWERFKIARFCVDGRVFLVKEEGEGAIRGGTWVDLSQVMYRYVL